MRIFTHRGNQTLGPYTLDRAQHELGNGNLKPTDMAIYELRQRIRQGFPQAEITAPAMPADIVANGTGTVPIILFVAMGGFGVTFAIGLLRGESVGLCAVMGVTGAVLASILLRLHK